MSSFIVLLAAAHWFCREDYETTGDQISSKGFSKVIQLKRVKSSGCNNSKNHSNKNNSSRSSNSSVSHDAIVLKVAPIIYPEAIGEQHILARCNHANIVQLFAHQITSPIPFQNDFLHLYIERCHYDLQSLLDKKRLTEENVVYLALQLMEALVYLHAEIKIAHGDIKPENILINIYSGKEAVLKLCDFGQAICLHQPTEHQILKYAREGTRYYLPPERLAAKDGGNSNNFNLSPAAADIYSAGVVFFEMAMGVRPYTMEELPNRDMEELPNRDMDSITANLNKTALAKVLRGMLRKEPEERFSAAQVLKALTEINSV